MCEQRLERDRRKMQSKTLAQRSAWESEEMSNLVRRYCIGKVFGKQKTFMERSKDRNCGKKSSTCRIENEELLVERDEDRKEAMKRPF